MDSFIDLIEIIDTENFLRITGVLIVLVTFGFGFVYAHYRLLLIAFMTLVSLICITDPMLMNAEQGTSEDLLALTVMLGKVAVSISFTALGVVSLRNFLIGKPNSKSTWFIVIEGLNKKRR